MNQNIQTIDHQVAVWGGHALKFIGLWLIILMVIAVCTSKFEHLRQLKDNMPIGVSSVDDKMRQLECLTRNIYWEAASEPFEGKVAVAQVTLNRVKSGKFASSVCGVVYQKNIIYEKVVCQFSWFCEGNHKVKAVYTPLWKESEEVAKRVLFEGFRLPSLEKAMYYHADYVQPGWKLPKIDKIGRHIFYGERT
jgi:spore germination cell wall hydrolase CwlJ-like protein